jgi:hypothetical protein
VFVRLLENGGGGGGCDIKVVHAGLKLSTFERPKARSTVLVQLQGCVCVMRSNVYKQVRRHACNAVRV